MQFSFLQLDPFVSCHDLRVSDIFFDNLKKNYVFFSYLISYLICYSSFTCVRDYSLWEDSKANTTIQEATLPLGDLYQDQRNVIIVLRYDSTLQKNISGPLKYVKGAQSIFEFTVKQRQFTNDAKTV